MDGSTAATRLSLIAAAERLFAERGIHGVSVREIAVDAGQRNTGAVRYHFGSKKGLVDAIFEHRMVPVNARRTDLMRSQEAGGGGRDAYDVAEAFALPLGELLDDPDRPSWYLRFCVQSAYPAHPDVATLGPAEVADRPWTRSLRAVHARALELMSVLPDEERDDRWHHFSGFVVHALAEREMRLQAGQGGRLTPSGCYLDGLVDAAAAILTAPVRGRARSDGEGLTTGRH